MLQLKVTDVLFPCQTTWFLHVGLKNILAHASLVSTHLPTSSVQLSCSVVSDSLRPHGSQHSRPPCPSQTPGVYSDSHPSSRWCIQPSHPLSSPSPPAPNPSQHQDLFQWVNSSHEVAKVLGVSALASVLPMNTRRGVVLFSEYLIQAEWKARDSVLIVIIQEYSIGLNFRLPSHHQNHYQSTKERLIDVLENNLETQNVHLLFQFPVETRVFNSKSKEWNAFGRRKVYWLCVYTSRRKRNKGKNTNWTPERSTQNKEVCSTFILSWVFCA